MNGGDNVHYISEFAYIYMIPLCIHTIPHTHGYDGVGSFRFSSFHKHELLHTILASLFLCQVSLLLCERCFQRAVLGNESDNYFTLICH
jgi:hypothetical protein